MSRVIEAPNYAAVDGPLIFLAGPIQGAYHWQNEAIKIIQTNAPELWIASPRRTVEVKYEKGEFTPSMYNEQVDWETHYLRCAGRKGVVMVWLAKEFEHRCDRAYAQTTRFELGEWKIKHEKEGAKLAVGIEEGFTNARYIRRRMMQDCPEIAIQETLESTRFAAIQLERQ